MTQARRRTVHPDDRSGIRAVEEATTGVGDGVNGGVEQAVLITGAYGSGKSSVAQEIADLLEKRNAPYALLDLDFLGWFDTGGVPTEHSVMLKNLAAMVGNYLAVGIRFFVLAGAVRDEAELDGLEAELSMPLKVVRLTVSLEEIEERLRPDPTAGRRDDLREAAAWVAGSIGAGIEDLTVPNDRQIREVATDILEWLGWQNT